MLWFKFPVSKCWMPFFQNVDMLPLIYIRRTFDLATCLTSKIISHAKMYHFKTWHHRIIIKVFSISVTKVFMFKMCAHYRKAQHKTVFNWSLLANSDMWIWKAITFLHYHGVCQKRVGYPARNFFPCCGRKTLIFWIQMAIKLRAPVHTEMILHPLYIQLPSE